MMATKKGQGPGERKGRGEREWTDAQRAKQSELMKAMHAKRRVNSLELPEKSAGIPDLTIGKLQEILEQFVKAGAKKGTQIIFPDMHGDPEIRREQGYIDGKIEDKVIIR